MITLVITVVFAGIWQFAALPPEIAVAQLGPGIAAVLFVFGFRDKDINRKEFPNDSKKPKGWHFLVLIGTVLLTGVLTFIIAWGVGEIAQFKVIDNIGIYFLWIPFGSVGEELGWRSYLQRILEKPVQPIIAYAILGLIWGLWHVQNFIYGALYITGFLLFTLSSSISIGLYSKKFSNNLWFASLFHVGINLCFVVFLAPALDNPIVMLIFGGTWVIMGVISIVFFREKKVNITQNPQILSQLHEI